MDPVCNIDLLPEEIIVEIFKYLTQNELSVVASVSRRWNEYAWNPELWKKVDVKFSWYGRSQNQIALTFSEKLPRSVTQMKLDFGLYSFENVWDGGLNFEEFCVKLQERCPLLHTLIMYRVLFSISLPSVIAICSKFLPNLKALILTASSFGNDWKKRECNDLPKIEILDVSHCQNFDRSCIYLFSKMPHLKKLNLNFTSNTAVGNKWFWREDHDMSFLQQLEVLDLGCTDICPQTFRILKNHAVNLTKLFLCRTRLKDNDLIFNDSVFPVLKTICLIVCRHVTSEGIVSILQSCQSLQSIYVDEEVAESFIEHPFFAENRSKSEIVKAVDVSDDCDDHEKLHFLL